MRPRNCFPISFHCRSNCERQRKERTECGGKCRVYRSSFLVLSHSIYALFHSPSAFLASQDLGQKLEQWSVAMGSNGSRVGVEHKPVHLPARRSVSFWWTVVSHFFCPSPDPRDGLLLLSPSHHHHILHKAPGSFRYTFVSTTARILRISCCYCGTDVTGSLLGLRRHEVGDACARICQIVFVNGMANCSGGKGNEAINFGAVKLASLLESLLSIVAMTSLLPVIIKKFWMSRLWTLFTLLLKNLDGVGQ